MTPEGIVECEKIGRQLADMEFKLASWRKSRDAFDTVIETMVKRMEMLNQRRKALMEEEG